MARRPEKSARPTPTTAGDASDDSARDPRHEMGDAGEESAARYLRGLGWRIVARNVNYRVGELDIVAHDGDQLVFVEVRTRRGRRGPRAEDSVTFPKQVRLTRAATAFMAMRDRWESARFDVVAVDGDGAKVVAHYRGAFEAREM